MKTFPQDAVIQGSTGIVHEGDQSSDSSVASEDSAEIVVDKQMKHFLAAISHPGTQGYPEPSRENGRAELNREGFTGRDDQQGRNSRPRSANVLGADQSVPRQRRDDAWHRHFSPAATRRWEEEGREIDRKMAALVTRTPSRPPPDIDAWRHMNSAQRDYESPSIRRWRGEEDLTTAEKVRLMDSVVREICHEQGIAFPTRSGNTRETESGSVPRPSLSTHYFEGSQGNERAHYGTIPGGPSDEPPS